MLRSRLPRRLWNGAPRDSAENTLITPLARLAAALDWRVNRPRSQLRSARPLLASEYGPDTVSTRRLANLAVFLIVGTVAAAAGYIPWQVPALLVPWIAGVWVATKAIKNAATERSEQWIETASYCVDALWLTAVCYFLGGADWIASAFFVLLVITAAASLSMPKAVVVAIVAWLGFATLAVGEGTGVLRLPPFGPVSNESVSLSFAVLTVVIQGTTLVLSVLLQQALLGALRQSEARHRAILNAASDMVVVLASNGVIHDASEVFAERTRFPIRSLVGRTFAEIVDEEHHARWMDVLRTACAGERVSFEIAYRSTHSNQGWISGTLVPLPAEGDEARVLMIARDVSADRTRQRRKLASA